MVTIENPKINPSKKIIDDLKIQIIYIPLESRLGYIYNPTVKPGDYVCIGTIIGKNNVSDIALTSSVSGTVVGFTDKYISNGKLVKCIVIENDFKEKHGLKPCAFMTQWNIRHGKDGVKYLDMCLTQRSSDFATAGCINQVQYLIFLHLIARHIGATPGRFTWFYNNIQIYDRHIEQAKELINREPVECQPEIWLNPEKKNFYDFTVDDIKIINYPRDEIKKINPQLKFDLGI